MCTRIFNNKVVDSVVTGRNMDWYWPLNCFLYFFDKTEVRYGVNTVLMAEGLEDAEDLVLTWKANFNSIGTVFGDDILGYTTVDGMNEEGFVVNALYDSDATYYSVADVREIRDNAAESNDIKIIGMSRWAQYLLDSFGTVEEAVSVISAEPLFIVNEKVPDSSQLDGTLHLAISDKTGDSAVIEVREGKYIIHSNKNINVVTNQPSYEKQSTLRAYWEFLWGTDNLVDSKELKPAQLRLVPGGNSSHERFERASYYYTFTKPDARKEDIPSQTRSLLAACSVPMLFDPKLKEDGRASYTIWTNLAESTAKRYHFLDTVTMSDAWLSFNDIVANDGCKRVSMIRVNGDEREHFFERHGNVVDALSETLNPYKY